MTRVAFVVTHLMGSGHLVRTRAVAAAVQAQGGHAVVISGGRPLPHLGPSPVEEITLPPVTSDGLNYARLLTAEGIEVDDTYRATRLSALLAAVDRISPDILVTETWPFGRGSLRAEFGAVAQRVAGKARRVASIRDIPEPPSDRKAARAEAALADYDAICVHGDAGVIGFDTVWPLRPTQAAKLHYCGYVAQDPPAPLVSDEVLVAVGGGVIGRPLLRLAALAARLGTRPWRLRVGGADAVHAIAALPASPAIVEPAAPDYRARLGGAACTVSLCGYNTATDVLATTTPALLVPMAEGGEREQILRAEALRAFGPRIASIDTLTPEQLNTAVERTIAAGPRPPATVNLNGAACAARLLLSL